MLFIGAVMIVLQGLHSLTAQDLTATVRIRADEPSIAIVEGQFSNGRSPQSLYFLDQLGSLKGLERRISNVRFADRDGKKMEAPLVNGHYLTSNVVGWAYRADISPADDRFAAAHVSRSDARGAILVLDDILPQMPSDSRSAKVKFELPASWKIATSERRVGENTYFAENFEKSVFTAGPALRAKTVRAGRAELSIGITGDWLFTDDEAVKMAISVFADYERIFGETPAEKIQIVITPFPGTVPVGQWEAGSRGTSITIVSSDMPFKNQSLQRLHEQLRHEIFHLWVPNGIKLTGNYDWFYEGFALYTSLKIAVAANRIRFDDMLETLGRAYDIGGRQFNDSLIGLSKSRWSGSNTSVYARGLLIAFLCDIAMLDGSKGKRSIDNLLRTVFDRHRSSPSHEANAAILNILRSHEPLKELVDRYIVAGDAVDWQVYLQMAGLGAVGNSGPTRLKAVTKPTRRQKQMLDELGYNNWRKLSGKNK